MIKKISITIIFFSFTYSYYIDKGDCIQDLTTGLFWQDTSVVTSNDITWGWYWTKASPVDENDTTGHKDWGEAGYLDDIDGANAYCLKLSISCPDSSGDWRVPTYNELNTIVDRTKGSNDISIIDDFEYKSGDKYWTSTTYENDHSKAWVINFQNGSDDFWSKDQEIKVRCVSD